jgi:plastocyanin
MVSHIIRFAGSAYLLLLLFACNNPEKQAVSPPENTAGSTLKSTPDSAVSTVQNEHTHTIEISKMKFNPEELTIPAGDTVIWINNDLTNHCVTEVNKAWTSSSMEPTKSFKKVITKNTDYFCAIHMVMKGKILVQ